MFHPNYKYITDKLPASLVKRAYQRLLHHSCTPIPLEQISEKNDRIEDYLCHTLKVYQNSLNRKRKTMNHKNSLQSAPLECPKGAVVSYPLSIGAEALKQQLLEYNRDTFGRFMQDLITTHKKQVKTNQQMHLEIENLKLRVQKVENFLAYLKSLTNSASGTYPNRV